jgi:hypothetical protein
MILREQYLESLKPNASDPSPRSLQLIIMALAANVHSVHTSLAQSLYQQARTVAEEDEMKVRAPSSVPISKRLDELNQ